MHHPGQERSGNQESRRKKGDQQEGDCTCERDDEDYIGEPAEVEAIVREMNKNLDGVKKVTIKKLQQMAEESPFTVVKCGEAQQKLVVSD